MRQRYVDEDEEGCHERRPSTPASARSIVYKANRVARNNKNDTWNFSFLPSYPEINRSKHNIFRVLLNLRDPLQTPIAIRFTDFFLKFRYLIMGRVVLADDRIEK